MTMDDIEYCLRNNGWVGVMLEDKYVHYELDLISDEHAYKFIFVPCDKDTKAANDAWYGFHKYYRTLISIKDVTDDIFTNYPATTESYSYVVLDENDYPEVGKAPVLVLQKLQKIRLGVKNLRKITIKQLNFKNNEGHFNEGIIPI